MSSIKSPLEHERRQAKASGDLSSLGHVYGPPKLAPLERLPKRHRVGPSASLDEYRTINYCESVSQPSGHVNFTSGGRAANPASVILPSAIILRARSLFFSVQFEFVRRGENRVT